MSFYNNKGVSKRLCGDNEEKKELKHMFGKFSKYFQSDCYYAELNTPITTPCLSSKPGCYYKTNPLSVVLSSSEHNEIKAARSILDRPHENVCTRTHNGSDRILESNTTLSVPTRGNSTKRTITANRPGAQSAPGNGCDVKYNSYHRHQMRMRGMLINSTNC